MGATMTIPTAIVCPSCGAVAFRTDAKIGSDFLYKCNGSKGQGIHVHGGAKAMPWKEPEQPADDAQIPMFGAYARTTDPDTSHEAAARVNVTALEATALRGLALLGGEGTSKEIARAVGKEWTTISPRMKPLERQGKVVRTDRRREGQTIWRLP